MAKLSKDLRNRFLPPVLALPALLIALLACATPPAGTTASVDRSVAVATVPAFNGAIISNRAYAARVDASDQVNIVPSASGQVARLDVWVGAMVNEGDVLGELRHGALDARLTEAQAKLTIAEAKLEQVMAALLPNWNAAVARLDAAQANLEQLENPTPADVQAADSAMLDARSRLAAAEAGLERLLNPTDVDLSEAKAAVITAENDLDNARIHLSQLKDPAGTDLLVARSAVEGARRSLASAQAELDQLSDPTSAALQSAQSAVTVAERDLDSATSRLNQLLEPSPDALAKAQEDVGSAQQRLNAVLSRQDDSTLNRAILGELSKGSIGDPWPEILEVRTDLLRNLDRMRDPFLNENLSEEQIQELKATISSQEERLAILMGEVIASSSIPVRIKAALWEESQARLGLQSARSRLRDLHNPDSDTLALARNSVASAQARLDSARAKHEELLNPSGSSVERAMSKVANAQATLDTAEARLAELEDPASDTITLATNRVATAGAAFAVAEARLQELRGPDENALNQARYRVLAAEMAVESAGARLAMIKTPTDASVASAKAAVIAAEREVMLNNPDYAVKIAQGAVDQAESQVALVQQQLEDLKIVAPFDGIITHNQLSVGSMASPQAPVFTIATADVVVSFLVEETVIGGLEPGRLLQFTSPAMPDQTLGLEVARINPTAGATGHSFLVKMKPVAADGRLRPGISGQVSVSIQRGDTLLVPKEAVLIAGSQSSIYVVRDGVAHLQPVAVGLIGDHHREILDGLQPGAQVVVSGQHLLTDATPVTVVDATSPAS